MVAGHRRERLSPLGSALPALMRAAVGHEGTILKSALDTAAP